MTPSSSFNPKPPAQADRRPADLFERRSASDRNHQTRNDASADGNPAAPRPLLFEARLNDKLASALADRRSSRSLRVSLTSGVCTEGRTIGFPNPRSQAFSNYVCSSNHLSVIHVQMRTRPKSLWPGGIDLHTTL